MSQNPSRFQVQLLSMLSSFTFFFFHYIEVYTILSSSQCIGNYPEVLNLQVVISQTQAPITPNFPSGFNRDIVGDYVHKIDVGSQLFTLLQSEMSADGVRCD